MSAQFSTHCAQASSETARVPEAASARKEPTEITTRQRLLTLRLVREGSFPAPSGYPSADIPIHSPRDVFDHMEPYAEREASESFWILPLDSQHQLIGAGPTVITRGILNSSLVHPREVFCAAIVAHAAGACSATTTRAATRHPRPTTAALPSSWPRLADCSTPRSRPRDHRSRPIRQLRGGRTLMSMSAHLRVRETTGPGDGARAGRSSRNGSMQPLMLFASAGCARRTEPIAP